MKPFALLVGAALALGAMLAPSAGASGELFHSEGEHTTLDIAANSQQLLATTVDFLACTSFSGHSTFVPKTTTEIKVVPTISECVTFMGPTHDIRPTSCGLLLTSETAPHNQIHVECSKPGDHIDLNTTFLGAELSCMTMPEQTPTGGGFSYKSISKGSGVGHIEAEVTVLGIEYTEDGFCGEGVANDGTYAGKVTIKGTNTAGVATEIWWG